MTNRPRPSPRARVRIVASLTLIAALTLAGCSEEPVPDAGRFVRQDRVDTVPLFFAAGSAALTVPDATRLQAVRAGLPSDAALSLAVSDAPVEARAREVGAALGRFVSTDPVPLAARPGQALLAITTRRVVNTDCLGPGQPVARDNWPDDDVFRPRSLPPGCAVATAMQMMAVDQEDLLRGRPLPPGAAFPVAHAIERYYDRWRTAGGTPDSTRSAGGTAPSQGAGGATPVTVPPSGGAVPADTSGADLLQGPLQPVTSGAPAASPAQ